MRDLLACCIAGCKLWFRNYNAFKKVMFTLIIGSYPLHGPFSCQVTNCQKQLTDLSDLLGHLKFHISKREEVHCPFKNYDRSFSVKSSFTSHLSRKHKYSTALHVSGAYCLPSFPSGSQFSVAESHSDEVPDDDGPEEDDWTLHK